VLVKGEQTFKAKWIVLAPEYKHLVSETSQPTSFIHRAIIITDKAVCGDEESILVIPPEGSNKGIFCKQTSHDSYCPSSRGMYILYQSSSRWQQKEIMP
jgi:hypothetical protein